MKKLIKFTILLLLATTVIALTPKCSHAQADTENKKGLIVADVGTGFDFKLYNPIALVINGGYEWRKVVVLFAWQPTRTSDINPACYVGIKAGYNIVETDKSNIVPMLGYYYKYSNGNGPDKIQNKFAGFGYSLKYTRVLGDQGGWFTEALYINNSFQVIAGVHINFFDL